MKTVPLRKTGKYDTGDTRAARQMYVAPTRKAGGKCNNPCYRKEHATGEMTTFEYRLPQPPRG